MSDDPQAIYSGHSAIHPADTQFYAQAGACLMEWAAIDSIMFNICASALGVTDDLASVVYRRTPTLDAQIALIADLISARFPKRSGEHDHACVKAFKDLKVRMASLAKVRNKIAHGGRLQVAHMYAGQEPRSDQTGPGFHSVVAPSSFKSSDGTHLDLSALRENQRAVYRLAMDLRAYRGEITTALRE